MQGDPKATLEKAEVVRRAALAPADPSSQDQRVAASASQTAAQARVEIAALRRAEAVIERELNAVEETGDSEEEAVSLDESQPQEAADVNQSETNRPEQNQASAAVAQVFNPVTSQPAVFSQFA